VVIVESRVHWLRVDFIYQLKYFANKLQSMTLTTQQQAHTHAGRMWHYLCLFPLRGGWGEGGWQGGRRRSNWDGEQVTQAYNSLFISHLAEMRSSGIDKVPEAPSIKWR